MSDDRCLDGNAAAGLLQELLPFEITSARTTCASCGALEPVGALRAYVDAPGVVVRCAHCGGVQLRVVRASRRYWLEMRGVSSVEIVSA